MGTWFELKLHERVWLKRFSPRYKTVCFLFEGYTLEGLLIGQVEDFWVVRTFFTNNYYLTEKIYNIPLGYMG